MDDSDLVLHSESGGKIATSNGKDMQKYYTILKPNEYENDEFYTIWSHLDMTNVISQWCRESAKFFHRPITVYP